MPFTRVEHERGEVLLPMASISNPGVRFPPPLLFVAGFLAGWALDRRWPSQVYPDAWATVGQFAGACLLGLGVGLVAWALVTFRRHRTAVFPNQPAARIVRDGPFRWTRNPMYVSMSLVYIGLALIMNALLPLFLLPVVLVLLTTLVIHREERYLESAFRDDYSAYCRDVRRWL